MTDKYRKHWWQFWRLDEYKIAAEAFERMYNETYQALIECNQELIDETRQHLIAAQKIEALERTIASLRTINLQKDNKKHPRKTNK